MTSRRSARNRLSFPTRLVLLCALLSGLPAFGADTATGSGLFSVRAFGATGDGHTLDTDAVNQAIIAAAEKGGTVEFPAGDYLCHSIRLRSHVTLRLGPGATIIAADPPATPGAPGYDFPEPNPAEHYQDFGHSHWHNSLIWGENLEYVSIVGPGRIYGRGLSRGNGRMSLPVGVTGPQDPNKLPSALMADGPVVVEPRPDLVPGPFKYPNARDTLPDGVGNKAIALKNCRNVTLSDFTILHGGHFGILATGVDNLVIDGLIIDTNRDGMDIDSCSNVRITNCSVNSPWDDGICLKSSHALGVGRITENVMIANCLVSGFDEGTLLDGTRRRELVRKAGPIGRIKLGTETGGGFRNIAIANCTFEYCRGLALEQVDGGVLEDVVVTNLVMRDIVNAPIFLRLGARLRAPGTPGPSQVRRVLISNVIAYGISSDYGILIAGLPGHPVEDVVVSNAKFYFRGGGTAAQAARIVPELPTEYPEPELFGTLPAWGLFARHVTNLQIRGVELHRLSDDLRPAVILDDVTGARFFDLQLPDARIQDRPLWSLAGVSRLHARDCTSLPDGEVPAAAAGTPTYY